MSKPCRSAATDSSPRWRESRSSNTVRVREARSAPDAGETRESADELTAPEEVASESASTDPVSNNRRFKLNPRAGSGFAP